MRIEDHWLDVQVCIVSFKSSKVEGNVVMEEELILAPTSLKFSELKKRVEKKYQQTAVVNDLELWDYALLMKSNL